MLAWLELQAVCLYCGHVESFLWSTTSPLHKVTGWDFLLVCFDISFWESIFSPQFPIWRFYSERIVLLWKARCKVCMCAKCCIALTGLSEQSQKESCCMICCCCLFHPPPPRCHHFPQVLISNDKVCLILQECDRCKFLTHTHTHRHTLRLHTLIQLILNMFSSLALRQQSRSSETLFVRQIVFLSSSRYFHFWIQFLPQHRYTFQNACMFPIHFDPRRTDYIMYIYMNSKYTERRKDNVVVKG